MSVLKWRGDAAEPADLGAESRAHVKRRCNSGRAPDELRGLNFDGGGGAASGHSRRSQLTGLEQLTGDIQLVPSCI